MNRRSTCGHRMNETPGGSFNCSRTVDKFGRVMIYAILITVYLGSLLVLLPDTANAEEVYGTITIRCDGCSSSRILLIFKRGERVIERARADDGKYSVYLSPGRYNVDIISNGKKGRATVESLSRKNRQDIDIQLK